MMLLRGLSSAVFAALFFAALFFAALLGGCAVSYNYAKGSTVDQSQTNADLQECRAAAERRTGSRQADEAINSCMQGKGYSVTKKDYGSYF